VIKHSAAGLGMVDVQYQQYSQGDKLKIVVTTSPAGGQQYYIDGQVRKDGLLGLAILFVLVVILVGRVWGALSLLGLVISFLLIFKLIIPLIFKGVDPVLAVVLGSTLVLPVTFYVSHGFNKKTHVGIIASFLGLILTGLLAVYAVGSVHLTGFASEEAGFLQVETAGGINVQALLLAGIVIGLLGVLDDITIGQASTVEQLKKANPKLSFWQLFTQGMKVGQDHISSMVNTLILVYAGSALPLFLLFFDNNKSFLEVIEVEPVAEEIVRMLVSSIGLILVAPLATLLAALVFGQPKTKAAN